MLQRSIHVLLGALALVLAICAPLKPREPNSDVVTTTTTVAAPTTSEADEQTPSTVPGASVVPLETVVTSPVVPSATVDADRDTVPSASVVAETPAP